MTPLTWRELLHPDYLLAFIDSYLLGFIPAAGLGSAASLAANGEAVTTAVSVWPSAVTLVAAGLIGLMNGIRSIRNLRTAPPSVKP